MTDQTQAPRAVTGEELAELRREIAASLAYVRETFKLMSAPQAVKGALYSRVGTSDWRAKEVQDKVLALLDRLEQGAGEVVGWTLRWPDGEILRAHSFVSEAAAQSWATHDGRGAQAQPLYAAPVPDAYKGAKASEGGHEAESDTGTFIDDKNRQHDAPQAGVAPQDACQDCGCHVPVWLAPSPLWNLVMGGPDATDDPGGYICVHCFIRRAEEAGQRPSAWVVLPEADAPQAGVVSVPVEPTEAMLQAMYENRFPPNSNPAGGLTRWATWDEAKASLAAEQARAAGMAEALEPFSALASTKLMLNGEEFIASDDYVFPAGPITFGHLRRARTALEARADGEGK